MTRIEIDIAIRQARWCLLSRYARRWDTSTYIRYSRLAAVRIRSEVV